MAYLESGRGKAIVLLHAFGTDRRLWQNQLDELSRQFRVVAPDLIGFGDYPVTDGSPISMDRYANAVIDLLDALDIRSATIVGLSVGGYVALSMARRTPERIDALVLANTRSSADTPAGVAARMAMAEAIRNGGAQAMVDSYGDRLFGSVATPDVRRSVREMMMSQPPASLISATLGMAARADHTAWLGNIAVPSLVLTGTADVLIPPSVSQELQAGIRGSRWVELDGTGHLSCIEAPRAFNAAIVSFMDEIA